MSRPPCTLPSVLLAAALAAGCASTRTPFPEKVGSSSQFKITVDSLAAPEAAALGRTFLLLPGNRDLREDDLEYRALARYVEAALGQQGYQPVAGDREAALLVRLSYGLGTPKVTATTWATSTGVAYPVGDFWFSVPARTATTQVSDYPVTLVLEAYDLRTPRRSPAWKTTVTSRSQVPNNVEGGIFVVHVYDVPELRIQVPYMLAGASGMLGSDTGGPIQVVVRGDDPRVPVIMGRAGR